MKHITILKTNLMRAAMTLALIVTCATAWAETVQTYYIDENGESHNVTATVLTGNEEQDVMGDVLLADGWYIVNGDVTISAATKRYCTNGAFNLILADGKTFTISSSLESAGIFESIGGTLSIYGQTLGSGKLDVTATGYLVNALYGRSCVNIVGGDVTATSVSGSGIYSVYGVTINGGQVCATGGSYGIESLGTLTLGCRKTTDYITASSYNKAATIMGDQTLYADATAYSGTDVSIPYGVTLRPYSSDDFSDDGNDEYTIHNATGWGVFCDYINNGESFSGKTVKLGANITITRMASTGGPYFRGTFDGQGHTLTLNYGSADNPIDAQFVAPFGEITWSTSPIFRNLTIDGHIYSTCTANVDGKNTGGLIGHLYGDVTIEHCTSNVEITNSSGGAGGFVGLCEHTVNFNDCLSSAVIHSAGGNNSGFVSWSRASGYEINFTGCVFNGKLLQIDGEGNSNGGFIGWTGSNKTVTITNCLYASAAPAEGETMADYNSATFARGWQEHCSETNSYFTTTLGTEQGTQAYSITAGNYVTVDYSGTPTNTYATSGIATYTTGIKCNNVLYAGSGDAVSLSLSHSDPSGYTFNGYTTTIGTLTGNANPYTLTMPDEDVTINAIFSQNPVTYLDENGEEQTKQPSEYTMLTNTMTTLGTAGEEIWYVVDGTIDFDQQISIAGDVHIILKDNAVMNVGTESDPVEVTGIYVAGGSLSIYGQSMGTDKGQLNIFASDGISTNYGSVTINGGQVTATGDGFGIYAFGGSVTINRGQVSATGNVYGIYAQNNNNSNSNITLGWTTPADYIYVNRYNADGTLTLTGTFIDEDGNTYSGTIEQVNGAYSINGKTLYPYVEGSVAYLDMNGQRQLRLAGEYTILNGSETNLGVEDQETWYVVEDTINFDHHISTAGDVHIILKNGAVMNVGTAQNPINGDDIQKYGIGNNASSNISIYGQTMGTNNGQLFVYSVGFSIYAGSGNFNCSSAKVTASSSETYCIVAYGDNLTLKDATVNVTGTTTIDARNVIINGGQVSANGVYYGIQGSQSVTINGGEVTATGDACYGITSYHGDVTINGGQVTAHGKIYGIYTQDSSQEGDVTINGGQVTATGDDYGIYIKNHNNNITLGWTNPTDYIYANKYYDNGTVSIAEGKAFITDDGATYTSGALTSEQLAAIAGKTLYPEGVIFKEVAGYGEGSGGWVFIASPVVGSISPSEVHNLLGQKISTDPDPALYNFDLYRLNPSNTMWENYHAHTDDFNLANGQGYLYATKADTTLVFAGEYNTENSKNVRLQEGWNLVGNPFTVNATIDRNYYTMNADGTGIVAEEVSSTIPIAPFTGVIVQAATENQTVTFTKASQQSPVPSQGNLQIALTQANTRGNALLDNAIVSFNEGAQLGKFYFGEQNGNIYIPQGGEEYAIVSVGGRDVPWRVSTGVNEIPVNFKAKENGTYTLTVSSTLNSKLSTLNYLHLIDNMTGADVDLLAPNGGDAMNRVSTYTFTAKTTDYESRFRLVFSVCGDANSDDEAPFAYYANGEIRLLVETCHGASLQLVDVMGHVLVSVGGHTRCVPTAGMTAGVYVLRLVNGEDVKVQKMVVE